MRYVYPSMLILSMVMNIIVVIISSKKFKYKKDEIVSMLLIDTVGILIGGVLYTFIFSGGFGFSSLGGLLGGLLFLGIYSILLKKDYKYILNLFMPSIPLMYAISKIGCFVAGCCHGIPYDGIGHIVYNNSLVAPKGISLFPVQIVETIVFLIIFIWIVYKYLKHNISFILIIKEIIICSIFKFLLDFLRYDHVTKVITPNQIMCLVLIVIGVIKLLSLNKKLEKSVFK